MSARLILKLKGGLGNQLFQYAAARSIAHRNDAPLYLDAHSGFVADSFARKFRLNYFDINAEVLPKPECVLLDREARLGRKLRSYRERCLMQYLGTAFDPLTSYMRVRRSAVIEGFWQSERYFRDVADLIRRELQLTEKVSPETAQLAGEIEQESAVAVHVRRLHGVSAAGVKVEGRFGGSAAHVSPDEYYRNGIERIREVRGKIRAFVFADSPEWAKENIRLGCPTTYVSHNGPERDYEDLFLMTRCRDYVIANSSFSWWGAWLGHAPDKIVCAPKNFSPYQGMRPLRDVYPSSWTVV